MASDSRGSAKILLGILRQELDLYRYEKEFFETRYSTPFSQYELLGKLKDWPSDALVDHARQFIRERALLSILARGRLRFLGEQIAAYNQNPEDPLFQEISKLYKGCMEMHSAIGEMYDQYSLTLQDLLNEDYARLRREAIGAIKQDLDIYVSALADGSSVFASALTKPGYGVGYTVLQTADGGYIIAGTRYSYEIKSLSQEVWLIKTDRNGTKVWDRTFGGERPDIGYSVQETRDGGYIIAGVTESFDACGKEAWLIKTDSRGGETWNRLFGGTHRYWARSIQQTRDGGYIFTGSMYSSSKEHLSQMAWLVKIDESSKKVWDRIFGGPQDDWGNCVQETSDGGYILTGATRSFGQGGNSALWLIKIDSNGDKEWDKTFSGPSDAVGYSVQETRDGGYIVAGSRVPCKGEPGEIWLIKTDAGGNELWDKTLGGSGDDVGRSVQQTSDGGYIVVGSKPSPNGASQSAWLIKTDENGNAVWDRTFGVSGWYEGKSVQQTRDGGYIITGSAYLYGTIGENSAVWLIKADEKGSKVWDKIFR